nr:alpha-(1->3)-arabinofuranosyltransferase family protein [Flexivirga meconopsidis]
MALIVGLNGLGSFHTDIKPEVYLAPGRMIGQYLAAWTSSPYLGSPNFNVGLVPVLLVTAALRGIGLSPEWTFKIFHFALWLATAWGTARFTRRLVPKAGKWGGLAAGVLILANPYTIQAGTTLAIALPMALLPWNLLAFVRAVQRPATGRWWSPANWTWPAVFGLTFFAMSGMNVAIVPLFGLLALLPLCVAAVRVWRTPWRHLLAVLGRCALFVVGVSIYWLVPGAGAISTGNQIVGESETLTGIAKVSSYPEVLRGLGLWSLYGQDNHGAWVPQDAVYLTSPVVMVLTILWPALALLSMHWLRGAARIFAALSVALAAVLMVGVFPSSQHPASPFGYVYKWFLELPAMGAFRTTNKVGAVLALGFAVAIAAGVVAVAPRLLRRDGVGPIAGALVALLLFAWTLPALTNRLYTSPMDIPAYWKNAAASIDKGDPNAAVLFLPGQTRPTYRWTVDRPDDVANSLFSRQVVIPETTPNASAPGGNFLQSLDGSVQNAVVPPGTMSTYARYLGADTVLMRHDTVWEDSGGLRPAQLAGLTDQDKGLTGVRNFGYEGEFVFANNTDAIAAGEQLLPPLQQYAVNDPRTSLRVEPTDNSLVVAGDGWSVPAMVAGGLLKDTPSFRYAQDLSPGQLATSLGRDHTLVLTDTNARRNAITNRLANNQGPLLSADQPLGLTRTLGDNPADQTVLQRSGALVSATAQGGAFFDLPYAVPENALDGDPATAWLFGDFERAAGNRLTITQPSAQKLDTIRIQQADIGTSKIDKVTVRAGGKAVTKRLPDLGYASFDLGGVSAKTVTVTVDSTRGSGYNLVGISDIQMPGQLAQRAARTPLTYDALYAKLTPAQRAEFDRTPMQVLLTRQQGSSSTSDDAETALRRVISLPDDRTFEAKAAVRVSGSYDAVYDQLAGYPSTLSARSSGFYFSNPDVRASAAADADGATAWQPGSNLADAWWQIGGPEREISSVRITQRPANGDPNGTDNAYARRVTISVDGKNVATGTLDRDGTTDIAMPEVDGKPLRGSTVRMTIDSTDGKQDGIPPKFPTIDTGLTMRPAKSAGPIDQAGADDPRCVQVATVDGNPLRMRPAAQLQGESTQGGEWVGCGDVELSKGQHRIEPVDGFTLDSLGLGDGSGGTATTPKQPATTIEDDSSTRKKLTVTTSGPATVVLGQSLADGWRATANGKDLGPAQLVDGYSAGWALPKAGTYTIDIRYTPQLVANVALGVSIVVVLGAVALAVFPFFRRKWGGADPAPDPEPDELEPAGDLAEDDDVRAEDGDMPAEATGRAGVLRRLRRLPRPAVEVALVLLGGFFVGWAGLVAGVAVVVLLRRRPVPSWWLQVAGAVLLLAAMAVYLIALGDLRGQISADGVTKSLLPHYLAGAGLVIGLSGALRERATPHVIPDGVDQEDDDRE